MRKHIRVCIAALAAGSVVFGAQGAWAGTITTPSATPFAVPGDATGSPLSFTVVASGYPSGNSVVSIEQCDGVPSSTPGYSPLDHCDDATSPAAVDVGANGIATFPANNANFGFFPFKGASPKNKFNCIAPGEADPDNGKQTFTNCQVRVATDNLNVVGDQAFLTMTLPVAPPPTTVIHVGDCKDAVQLIKLTTPVKGAGLGDQTVDNVKAAGNLAKDQGSHQPVHGGGTCSGVTPHGDKHIPFPGSGNNVVSGLTAKSMAVSITGNATCASDAPNQGVDASADNAYPLHGKITWTFNDTYNDLTTGLAKPYKMQAMVQVLGFSADFADVIDLSGIVLSGVSAGARVTGQVWFDPVSKTGGGSGYNTGYEVDLANASGCADAVPTPGNANITTVLSGSGNTTPSLLGSAVPGLSFDFGE